MINQKELSFEGDFVIITEEQADQFTKLGLPTEVRYVVSKDTMDALRALTAVLIPIKEEAPKAKAKRTVRRKGYNNVNKSIVRVGFPTGWLKEADKLTVDSKAAKAAAAFMCANLSDNAVKSRSWCLQQLVDSGFSEIQAAQQLYYLCRTAGVLVPFTEGEAVFTTGDEEGK
jgi:hypothetical protein